VSCGGALSLLTRFCNQFDADATVSLSDGDHEQTPIRYSRQRSANTDRVRSDEDDASYDDRDGSPSSSIAQLECRRGNSLSWHSKTSTTDSSAETAHHRPDNRLIRRSPPKSSTSVIGFDMPSSARISVTTTRSNHVAASAKGIKRNLAASLPTTSSSKSARTFGEDVAYRVTHQSAIASDDEHRMQKKFAEYYSRLTSRRTRKFQFPAPSTMSKKPNAFDIASPDVYSASSLNDCRSTFDGNQDWRLLQPFRHRMTGCAADAFKTFDSTGRLSGTLRRQPHALDDVVEPYNALRDISLRPPKTMTADRFFGRKLTELSLGGARNISSLQGQFLPPSPLHEMLYPIEQVNASACGEMRLSVRPTFSQKTLTMYAGDRYHDDTGSGNSSLVDSRSGTFGFPWNVGNVRGMISSDPTCTWFGSRDALTAPSLFASLAHGPSSRVPPFIGHSVLGNRASDLPWPFIVSDMRGLRPTPAQQLSSAFALRRLDRLDHVAF